MTGTEFKRMLEYAIVEGRKVFGDAAAEMEQRTKLHDRLGAGDDANYVEDLDLIASTLLFEVTNTLRRTMETARVRIAEREGREQFERLRARDDDRAKEDSR